MTAPRPGTNCIDKRALTQLAMRASIKTRTRAGADLVSPICIFDLCERLGVKVRFVDINMEGMYDRAPEPRIHLSSLRPLPRRETMTVSSRFRGGGVPSIRPPPRSSR